MRSLHRSISQSRLYSESEGGKGRSELSSTWTRFTNRHHAEFNAYALPPLAQSCIFSVHTARYYRATSVQTHECSFQIAFEAKSSFYIQLQSDACACTQCLELSPDAIEQQWEQQSRFTGRSNSFAQFARSCGFGVCSQGSVYSLRIYTLDAEGFSREQTRLNITEIALPAASASSAAPSAAAADAAAPVEEKPKEKTLFNITLTKIDAAQKAKAIREVKAVMPSMNLVEVRRFTVCLLYLLELTV